MIQISLNKGTLLFGFCILFGLFATNLADPIPYKDCGSLSVFPLASFLIIII